MKVNGQPTWVSSLKKFIVPYYQTTLVIRSSFVKQSVSFSYQLVKINCYCGGRGGGDDDDGQRGHRFERVSV